MSLYFEDFAILYFTGHITNMFRFLFFVIRSLLQFTYTYYYFRLNEHQPSDVIENLPDAGYKSRAFNDLSDGLFSC